jgi:hypothetical protein
MNRSLVSVALAAAISTTGCTPLAVGCVIGGGASLVGAKVVYKDNCDGEGCAYANVMAALLAVIGVGLVLGGGIDLAVEHH